jgi:hypothetical protein
MLKPDFWWPSAPRAEIDHRAREARLRIEHLERLLKLRGLPVRSLQRWLDHRRGPGFLRGGRMQGGSARIPATRMWRPKSRDIPTDICVVSCHCL